MTSQPLDRVAVALDTSEWSTFERWCEIFGPRVGVLKVGLEAYTRWGPRAVEAARGRGRRVFLDLKLHDIPQTVAAAAAAAAAHGVDYLTLHTAGGPEMLTTARAAAGDQVRLLGVTLLTHLDEAALRLLDLPGSPSRRVRALAALAHESGCDGAVCSPLELAAVRAERARPFLLVAPGIRPEAVARDDQRRTATPEAALAAGADMLVVGRPLTRVVDPEAALDRLERQLR